MLGVAGVLAQSVLVPDVFWYEAALHLPPGLGPVNLGSTLAIQFLMMHWVEVRRWQDIRKPGSVSEDPIFKGNKLPAGEVGYPGGIFDPLGFAKGNVMELQTKEIKNGRLAMVAFMGFVFAAQTTGKGPLAALSAHMADPAHANWTTNIGTCALPASVEVSPGVSIPLICLWPGQ
jgi:light-harvesting complex I chlorophyll a/b binding protein 4